MINEGRTIEITSAKVEDTGSYKCVATNDAGTDEINYDLKVLGKQKNGKDQS